MVLQLSLHYTSKMCLHVFELCTGFHIEFFNGGEKDAPPPQYVLYGKCGSQQLYTV